MLNLSPRSYRCCFVALRLETCYKELLKSSLQRKHSSVEVTPHLSHAVTLTPSETVFHLVPPKK